MEVRNVIFNLEEVRKEIGMTQEQLSKKSGVSRTIISGMENGVIVNTNTKTLKRLADALGVSIDKIFSV